MKPRSFLASLATAQRNADRPETTRYDSASDVLLVRRGQAWIAAIETSEPPRTKKADIEKGEDQKDRWR